MMEESREKEAQQAYVKLLAGQGVSQRVLIQREFIIIRLSAYLKEIPCDGIHYRQAVDRFITCLDVAEIPTVLPVIRDFFSFWVRDIKAIAAMSQAKVFNGGEYSPVPAQDELFKHWYYLDNISLNKTENEILDAFLNNLKKREIDPVICKERMRMARYLLISLRTVYHKQSHSYRQTVDRTLPLFNALGSQHAFLSVSREFYYLWRGEAPQSKKQNPKEERNLAFAA